MKTLPIIVAILILPIVSLSQRDVLPFKSKGYWGFVRDTGGVVIDSKYDAVKKEFLRIDDNDLHYYIIEKDGLLGFIDIKGKEVLPPIYTLKPTVIKTRPLMIKVREGKKNIIVDENGAKIMEDNYDYITTAGYDYLYVKKGEKWGVFKKGKGLVLPLEFDGFGASQVSYNRRVPKGYFVFKKDKLRGIIDSIGNVVIPPAFEELWIMKNIIIAKRPNEAKHSLLELSGDSLNIYCQSVSWLNKDFFRIRIDEPFARLWKVNTKTWTTPDSLYHDLQDLDFSGKYIRTNIENQGYGIIDTSGNTILSPKYFKIVAFNPKRHIFKYQLSEEQWGLVENGDKILHDTIFDAINTLSDSLAIVHKGDKKGLLNFKGELVIPVEYDKIDIDGNTILTFLDHQMTRFTFLPDGSVTKEKQLKNVFTLRAGYSNLYKGRSTQSSFARRVPWSAYTQNINRNNLTTFKEKKLKGLRDATTNQIILPAEYQSIIRVNGTDLALCYKKLDEPEIVLESIYRTEMTRQLHIYHEKERRFIHSEIIGLQMMDFGQSEYAAYLRRDGKFGLISRNGELKKYDNGQLFLTTYIGGYPTFEPRARLYSGGQIEILEWMATSPNDIGCMKDIANAFNIKHSNVLDNHRLMLKKGLWTYLDEKGEMMTPPAFITAQNFKDSIAICELPVGFGVINIQMDTILPFDFTNIRDYNNNSSSSYFEVFKKNTKPVYLDKHGVVIPELEPYQSIGIFKNDLALVQKDELFGYINKNYQEVIPCQWKYARPFNEGMAAIFHEKRWHFIDTTGQLVLTLKENIRNVGTMKSGMAWFQVGSFYGYASKDAPVAIFPKYKEALDFQGDIAVVKDKTGFGIINKTGEYIVKPSFTQIKQFNASGIAPYKTQDSHLFGLIDHNGKIITDTKYDFIGHFENGYAKVKVGYLYGLIDSLGNEILPVQFEEVGFVKENLVKVRPRYGQWQYRDIHNRLIIKGPFQQAHDFENGYAAVVKRTGVDPTYSIINTKGEIIYTSTPENKIINFSENIRGIRRTQEDKITSRKTTDFYFADTSNNVIGGYYQEIEPFENGLAIVKTQKGWGLIDQQGLYIFEPKYRKIVRQNNNLFKAITIVHKGIYNKDGTPLLEPIYDVLDGKNTNIRIEKDGEVGYYRMNNGWILQIEN